MHRDCPEGTACYIRHPKQQQGISANEAIRRYSKESGISVKTLEKWYWPGKVQPKPKPKEISLVERVIKLLEKLNQEELRQVKAFLLDEHEVSNVD